MDKLKLISVQKELLQKKIVIFSVREFQQIFNVSPKTVRAFLSYHSKKGSFKRIKRGAYASSASPPTKFEIANYLWRPSYISFETALSFYGIIPETVYTITSATTRPPKEFSVDNQSYGYHRIKKGLFFGYRPTKIGDRIIMIAEKEKALLDYLYLLSLKKEPLNERLDVTKIDTDKLGLYVGHFKKGVKKNRALIKLINKVYI